MGATDELLELLGHEDPDVVRRLLGVIAEDGTAQAALACALVFLHWNDDLHEDAQRALRGMANESTAGELLGMLRSPDSQRRRLAAIALAGMGWEPARATLRELLSGEEDIMRALLTGAFAIAPDGAMLPALVERLFDESAPVATAAAIAVGKLDPSAGLEVATDRMLDSDPEVRARALEALSQLSLHFAVSTLVRGLKSDDPGDLVRTIWSLGLVGSRGALQALAGLLDEVTDPALRYSVIANVGRTEDRRALDVLTPILQEEDPIAREVAARAIGELDPGAGAQALIGIANDPEPGLRGAVAQALGGNDSEEALEALSALLKDESATVRARAAASLGESEAPDAIPALTEALRDEVREVRLAATAALVGIEHRRSVPGLLEALKDPYPGIRATAAMGLGIIGHKSAIPGLAEALSEPAARVREEVVRALGEIGGSKAIAALKGAAKDSDPDVREAVQWALERARQAGTKHERR